MCGIVGFTHKTGVVSSDPIQRAVASLTHRGPDQQGIFRSNFISVGATRLKIIDLHLGSQPMLAEDGDTVLVFNGEIYNHRELCNELLSLGHRIYSRSDTETILHAFLEWDTDCFSRFRGMFAVALWTESKKRLVLARDRLGIKPLYLCRFEDDLFFASELKAILVHPGVDRRLNLAGLDFYLSLNYVPGPWTLVEGIEKLPPGHWLEWRDGTTHQEQFWQLLFEVQRHWTQESAKEQLNYLLKESVREHLVSDVPLGIWLSGGLDSSTILHYAASTGSSRLKTFSISFRSRSFDERTYARRVAAYYGTEHHEFDLNSNVNLRDAIEDLAYYSDEPSADSGAIPVWFLSRMSREHVTVALSGEGSDELLGGYQTYLADHWARFARIFPKLARRAAFGVLRHWPVSDEKIGLEYKLKRFLEGSLLPPVEAHFYWNGTFSEEQKRSFFKGAGNGSISAMLWQLHAPPDSVGYLNRFLWLDQLCYLPDDILYKSDRVSMAHSLEVRPPFLDHRLVEFAASLPEHFKIRRLEQKYLLKEIIKEKLPPFILRREKIGLDIPTHEWLRGVLRPLLLDTLTPDAIAQTKLFRTDVIQSFIRQHLERRANLGFHLWGLMTLFLWMKRWHIRSTPFYEAKIEPLAKIPTFT